MSGKKFIKKFALSEKDVMNTPSSRNGGIFVSLFLANIRFTTDRNTLLLVLELQNLSSKFLVYFDLAGSTMALASSLTVFNTILSFSGIPFRFYINNKHDDSFL